MKIAAGMPWSEWQAPQFVVCQLHDIVVWDWEGLRGSPEALHDLGRVIGDLRPIMKLPPKLQADCINTRISAAKDREVMLVIQDGGWHALVPKAREMLTAAETAQITWEAADIWKAAGNLIVERAEHTQRGCTLRLMTGMCHAVNADLDRIEAGIEVQQGYATTTSVRLYARRLLCGNAFTAPVGEWEWTRRNKPMALEGRKYQIEWLRRSVGAALAFFPSVVKNARLMADTRLVHSGDRFRELARTVGVKPRGVAAEQRLWHIFSLEAPVDTEWKAVCVLMRYARMMPDPAAGRMRDALGKHVASWTLERPT